MKKIIVVDDSSVLRNTIKNALEGAGFDVVGTAKGSHDFFRIMEKGAQPHYLLLDMFFPDESGLDILREVKAKYPGLKVIVITAVNKESLNKEIRSQGADDILHKPFDLDDLITVIQKIPS